VNVSVFVRHSVHEWRGGCCLSLQCSCIILQTCRHAVNSLVNAALVIHLKTPASVRLRWLFETWLVFVRMLALCRHNVNVQNSYCRCC